MKLVKEYMITGNKVIDNVTIVLVDGIDPEQGLKALKISTANVKFERCILFSFREPSNKCEEIEFIKIDKLDWVGYNQFIISELNNYIETPYVLVIQTDGFVLNANKWTDDFLQYDYIGAPWLRKTILKSKWISESIKNTNTFSLVGNGGFSLRSKKLLEETSNSPFECDGPEDAYICQTHYNYFKDKIKFAPIGVAKQFSTDPYDNTSFGFHGDKNIIERIKHDY